MKAHTKAMDATVFLPDYLLEECFSEWGQEGAEDMEEYQPAIMYMPQMLHILPREETEKYKLLPAFSDSFMRMED